MKHPMKGKGVGPGGSGCWHGGLFLINMANKKRIMVMITARGVVNDDERVGIELGSMLQAIPSTGTTLFMNCNAQSGEQWL